MSEELNNLLFIRVAVDWLEAMASLLWVIVRTASEAFLAVKAQQLLCPCPVDSNTLAGAVSHRTLVVLKLYVVSVQIL